MRQEFGSLHAISWRPLSAPVAHILRPAAATASGSYDVGSVNTSVRWSRQSMVSAWPRHGLFARLAPLRDSGRFSEQRQRVSLDHRETLLHAELPIPVCLHDNRFSHLLFLSL